MRPYLLHGNRKYKPTFIPILIYDLCLHHMQSWFLNFAYIVQFWRGTLGEANEAFSTRQPKGEITVLIEGKLIAIDDAPSEEFLEHELRELTAKGHTQLQLTCP